MSFALEQIRPVAEALLEKLAPACTQIEIAGSIRRGKLASIKDIEIVAASKPFVPAFGMRVKDVPPDALTALLNDFIRQGTSPTRQ